jgi:hypothetical protein
MYGIFQYHRPVLSVLSPGAYSKLSPPSYCTSLTGSRRIHGPMQFLHGQRAKQNFDIQLTK